jgi:hypothetical protein
MSNFLAGQLWIPAADDVGDSFGAPTRIHKDGDIVYTLHLLHCRNL